MQIGINSYVQLIGQTPLIKLDTNIKNSNAKIFAKCEFLNPSKSLKDRIARHMIDKAIEYGQLNEGDTIVCASSGNTGCSVAMLGQLKGFSVIVVTSTKCSQEKLNHIKAYGAQLILKNEVDYMSFANQLALDNNYFNINQYDNPYNTEAYYDSLGPELWSQSEQAITHFVMTGSTFGCITGTAKYLKEQNPNIKVILADPVNSNIYDYYYQGYLNNQHIEPSRRIPYVIEGAGKSRPTKCLDFSVIDDVIQVSDQDAINCCHELAKTEGLLVGGSSGLNVHAARQVAKSNNNANIVTILCDSGLKYLTKIYDPQFLKQHNLA